MNSIRNTEVEEPSSFYDYYADTKAKVKTHHVMLVFFIITVIVLFHFRHKLAAAHDRYRTRRRLRFSRIPSDENGFEDDLENGLSSSTFDIGENISNNDQRQGLLQNAKEEVKRIMDNSNLTFDQARYQYTQQQLDENGIGEDGTPLDPKTVTFSHR